MRELPKHGTNNSLRNLTHLSLTLYRGKQCEAAWVHEAGLVKARMIGGIGGLK